MRYERTSDERVTWTQSRTIAFLVIHFIPFLAFFTGITWFHVWLCVGLYFGRMFFVTAGYHRYFAHRAYSLNRFWQFVIALGATTSAQKGVVWWAANNRHHHRYSDQPEDIHSPLKGFWWSHVGWILSKKYKETKLDLVKDFAKFPELRWLDRYDLVPAIVLGALVLLLWGPAALFFSFFLSTIILWHGTFTINSLSHVFGRRVFVTNDSSRNSFLLALVTNGEGWHNNHHHFCSSARQGFHWWQIDVSYYGLRLLDLLGIAKNLKGVPKKIKQIRLVREGYADVGILKTRLEKAARLLVSARKKTGAYYEKRRARFERAFRAAQLHGVQMASSTRELATQLKIQTPRRRQLLS